MTALRLDGVVKHFGASRVLDSVNLEVAGGELTAVLGPSGCGKTTLLRLIAGFMHVDAGMIALDDRTVSGPGCHVPAQARRVGYVAQEGALFPHLDVRRNISFGLPGRRRRADPRVEEMLELVGLDASYAKRYPHQLSGGQQQRVAVARALAPRPTLVLLDEPFASLDANLRQDTGRAVADALRASRATAVLVTHDQSEALSLVDRVAVMRDGAIVQVDTPQHVYRRPIDPRVAAFVGGSVLLPGRLGDGVVACALGEVPVADGAPSRGGAVDVLIRPEQIRVRPGTHRTGVQARVLDVSYYGHDADVRLALLDDHRAVVARIADEIVPEPGDIVRLLVQGAARVFPQAAATVADGAGPSIDACDDHAALPASVPIAHPALSQP